MLTALGDLDERLGERRHPLLGRGSVHASLISGGNDLATYPERCTIGIERRTLPGEGAAEVERELAQLLAGCREADPRSRRRAAPCSCGSRSRQARTSAW